MTAPGSPATPPAQPDDNADAAQTRRLTGQTPKTRARGRDQTREALRRQLPAELLAVATRLAAQIEHLDVPGLLEVAIATETLTSVADGPDTSGEPAGDTPRRWPMIGPPSPAALGRDT